MANKSKKQGVGCLLLVSLPFAGVGFFLVWLVLSTTVEWWQMQSWIEVEAQIVHAELEVNHDGEGGTTYRALAKYRYEFQGKRYIGERVSIHTSADNLGDFHQEKARLLRSHWVNRKPISCYVDPSSPADSVLFRELRLEKIGFYLLFMVTFGGLACVAFAFHHVDRKRETESELLKETHPDEPWMWKPDWAKGEIRSSSKAKMITTILFAAFWNLVSSPLLFFLPEEWRKGNYLAAIGFIFPIVGICLFVWAVKLIFLWLKYGESLLQMPSTPGVIGGQFLGVVRVPSKVRTTGGFCNTLSCIHRYTTDSGDSRSTTERVLWQQSQTITRELSQDASACSTIPVQFLIPFGEKGSEKGRIIWKLEVDAPTTGWDFHVEFEVPVFETKDSSSDFQPQNDAISAFVQNETIDSKYRKCKVRREDTLHGLRIAFPLLRNIGTTFGFTVFLGIWTGAIGLLWHLEAPLVFPIIFGIFELLLLCFAVDLWLWTSQIEVEPGRIAIRSGVPFLKKSHVYSASEINKIDVVSGMQSGKTLYHDLQIVDSQGEKIIFGKRIANQVLANAILEDILNVMTNGHESTVEAVEDQSLVGV